MKKRSHKIKHAVVLINFKKISDTLVCINSIRASKDTPYIIVVDNSASTDETQKLRAALRGGEVIAAEGNIGYSGANNLGIKRALALGAQVVYLLNNDTEVDPNLFFRAYRYVEGKNRIAGGKIYYAKGYEYHSEQRGQGNILWYAGGYFDWKSVIARHIGVDEEDHGQYDRTQPVDFITGCFIAIPRKVCTRVGLLETAFFLYLEDADFCLRAKAHGVEAMYNPTLILYHRNSSATVAGSPLVDYYLTRNRLFLGMHYGSLRLRLALIREALFRNWQSTIRRQAFLDYIWGKMGNRNDIITQISEK